MIDIKSLTYDELDCKLTSLGYEKYRTSQIFNWIYKERVSSFDEMSNISKVMRGKLSSEFIITLPIIKKVLTSKDNETSKILYELSDGNMIESVLMKYKHGYTICISTQAGCRMGCRFCASTKRGLNRSLMPSEMLDQILFTEKEFCVKISNIVLMGTGEPLDNFDNVIKFLELVNDERGINISIRNISLSTCGLVDKIEKLRLLRPGLTLSISLHAPNDAIRKQIMPIANKYKIDDLLNEVKTYADYTKRRVAIEYTLIKNINDSIKNAEELSSRLKGMLVHVNLIPLNPSDECNWERPDSNRIKRFLAVLQENGISATIRRELGTDINAACGQLRLRYSGDLPAFEGS